MNSFRRQLFPKIGFIFRAFVEITRDLRRNRLITYSGRWITYIVEIINERAPISLLCNNGEVTLKV